MNRCQQCAQPLPPPAGTGRPRRYCSGRCREAARRDRIVLIVPFDPVGAPPSDRVVDGESRLVESVLELRNAAVVLRRLSSVVRRPLAVRAIRVSDGLDGLLDRNFPNGDDL